MTYQTFDTVGTVYLIHFETKLAHAQHYLGFTTDLEQRLKSHSGKNGSKLMNAVNENEIKWSVSRTWTKPKSFERELKNCANSPVLCPVCSGEKAYNRKK